MPFSPSPLIDIAMVMDLLSLRIVLQNVVRDFDPDLIPPTCQEWLSIQEQDSDRPWPVTGRLIDSEQAAGRAHQEPGRRIENVGDASAQRHLQDLQRIPGRLTIAHQAPRR